MASGDMFPDCAMCHRNIMVCECNGSGLKPTVEVELDHEKRVMHTTARVPNVPLNPEDIKALEEGMAKVTDAAARIAPRPTLEQLEEKQRLQEALQAKLKGQFAEAQSIGRAMAKLGGVVARLRGMGMCGVKVELQCWDNRWLAQVIGLAEGDEDSARGLAHNQSTPEEAVALAIQRFDAHIAEMAASNEKQNAEGVEPVG